MSKSETIDDIDELVEKLMAPRSTSLPAKPRAIGRAEEMSIPDDIENPPPLLAGKERIHTGIDELDAFTFGSSPTSAKPGVQEPVQEAGLQEQNTEFGDDNVALYVPGNEGACRKLVDGVVSADSRTFTLGDPTGPLVILRLPDKDALPAEIRWEGDLPATTLATPADIMQRAEELRWFQRAGGKNAKSLVRTHPPRAFVGDYLSQMRGQYGARPLRGIVRVPRIDDAGMIHFVSSKATPRDWAVPRQIARI
jgi:hypothetical protein